MPTTASAPSIFPSGCAPTSSATPTKPIAIPTSRDPVTRTSRKNTNASSALKIGTDAWMIDASPESMRVSPHERSQNGIAVLTSATTTSQRQLRADLRGRLAGADRERHDERERDRREPEPAEDQGRRRELAVGDLDEHEGRAPDQRERDQHRQIAPSHL